MAVKMGTFCVVKNTTKPEFSAEADEYFALHVQDDEDNGKEFALLFTYTEIEKHLHVTTVSPYFVTMLGHLYPITIEGRTTRIIQLVATKGFDNLLVKSGCTLNKSQILGRARISKDGVVLLSIPNHIFKRAKARAIANTELVPKKGRLANLFD